MNEEKPQDWTPTTPQADAMHAAFGAHGEPSVEAQEEKARRELAEAVFGKRPGGGPQGLSRAMQFLKARYDASAKELVDIVETDLPAETIALFLRYGLGLPVRWKPRAPEEFLPEEYLAFRDAAPMPAYRLNANTAELNPHKVVTGHQSQAIADGHYIDPLLLHPDLVDLGLDARNERNRPKS